jgi:hypothetical protein
MPDRRCTGRVARTLRLPVASTGRVPDSIFLPAEKIEPGGDNYTCWDAVALRPQRAPMQLASPILAR